MNLISLRSFLNSGNSLIWAIAATALSCTDVSNTESTKDTVATVSDSLPAIGTDTSAGYLATNISPQSPSDGPIEARIRFDNFSLVINGFYLYNVDPMEGTTLTEEPTIEPLDKDSTGKVVYVEKDTFRLSEDLDNHLYNTLLQIIPRHPDDRFVLSMGYLTLLNEVINPTDLSQEDLSSLYADIQYYNEVSSFRKIQDSSNYYYRVLAFSKEFNEVEDKFYKEDLERVKKKYQLKDTFVMLQGDYEIQVDLAKGKKLFTYDTNSYIFRIERYRGTKLQETKYVTVEIARGC